MEVHFTIEQELQLAQVAASAGTNPERLVKEAALRLLPEEAASRKHPAKSATEAMRALRARIKPDPEGWTVRDYVLLGRR